MIATNFFALEYTYLYQFEHNLDGKQELVIPISLNPVKLHVFCLCCMHKCFKTQGLCSIPNAPQNHSQRDALARWWPSFQMGLRKPGISSSVSIFFSIYFLQRFLSEIYTKLFSDSSLSASNPGLLPEKWAHEKHIRLLETLFHVLIQGPLKKCLP